MSDQMPRVVAHENDWTPEARASFSRRRRGRNFALLAVLGGFCLLIYTIAIIKLRAYGYMW